ncbi:hypothetical protein TWF481_006671 [Arthrobotrys musiformis]|uniref:Peptidase A1 domain-containing protein n=1 Tax=Arthrobotrys musiformis TaxID=47236 RepID=A0AAV9W9B3_9PEZI
MAPIPRILPFCNLVTSATAVLAIPTSTPVATQQFGADPKAPKKPVPGKIKVKSDPFTFFAQIDIGEVEPANLVLDTLSDFSAVVRGRRCGTRREPVQILIDGGQTSIEKDPRTNLFRSIYSDGSWVLGTQYWYGNISSPASAGLDNPASYHGYLALPTRQSQFKRIGKDGVLGLSREQDDLESISEEGVYVSTPVGGDRFDSRLPWGKKKPPRNGGYSFFTTYLNWRDPLNQYLGLDYLDDRKLGSPIAKVNLVTRHNSADIKDWRVGLNQTSVQTVMYWPTGQDNEYHQRKLVLQGGYSSGIDLLFLLDTKSEFTFIAGRHASAIAKAMGGECKFFSSVAGDINTLEGDDYRGSNVKFGGNICFIPCLHHFGKSGFFQKNPITLDLPFGETYIRISEDVPLAAYAYDASRFDSREECVPQPNRPCETICVSYIQPLEFNGPNYQHVEIDPFGRINEFSSREFVYGHTVWANVIAKWGLNETAVSLWYYQDANLNTKFNPQKVPADEVE